MSNKYNVHNHSGDCHWWTYRICDCGYLMRANSHDFGEPSEQTISDWCEHSANCQRAVEAQRQCASLKEQLRISDEGWAFHNQRANELMGRLTAYEKQWTDMDQTIGKFAKDNSQLKKRNAVMREALEFIAEDYAEMSRDWQQVAHDALPEGPEGGD